MRLRERRKFGKFLRRQERQRRAEQKHRRGAHWVWTSYGVQAILNPADIRGRPPRMRGSRYVLHRNKQSRFRLWGPVPSFMRDSEIPPWAHPDQRYAGR